MAHIAIFNPAFDVSYWGIEHALLLVGKTANFSLASLPLQKSMPTFNIASSIVLNNTRLVNIRNFLILQNLNFDLHLSIMRS